MSGHNLMDYKDSCTNFCGLPPPHCFGKTYFSSVRSMYFLDLCISIQQYRHTVYSQKYIANVINNYAFVLRTTMMKKSRQMGRKGRAHRKSIFIWIRSADSSQSVFPGCLLKSCNCLHNLCFVKRKKKKEGGNPNNPHIFFILFLLISWCF